MNAPFDNLMSFATAWLCDLNCSSALLAWDATDDDYIAWDDYEENDFFIRKLLFEGLKNGLRSYIFNKKA